MDSAAFSFTYIVKFADLKLVFSWFTLFNTRSARQDYTMSQDQQMMLVQGRNLKFQLIICKYTSCKDF